MAKRGKRTPSSERGTPTQVPPWWITEIHKELKARGWEPVDLAEAIAGGRNDRFPAAQTMVSRFLHNVTTTVENAERIAAVLKLPPYEFKARSRAEADRIQAAIEDRGELAEAMLLRGLLAALRQKGATFEDALAALRSSAGLAAQPPK